LLQIFCDWRAEVSIFAVDHSVAKLKEHRSKTVWNLRAELENRGFFRRVRRRTSRLVNSLNTVEVGAGELVRKFNHRTQPTIARAATHGSLFRVTDLRLRFEMACGRPRFKVATRWKHPRQIPQSISLANNW